MDEGFVSRGGSWQGSDSESILADIAKDAEDLCLRGEAAQCHDDRH